MDAVREAARAFAKDYWRELPKYAERFDSDAGDGETTVQIADAAIRWWMKDADA